MIKTKTSKMAQYNDVYELLSRKIDVAYIKYPVLTFFAYDAFVSQVMIIFYAINNKFKSTMAGQCAHES
jgi:hypothetical protein